MAGALIGDQLAFVARLFGIVLEDSPWLEF
jgi:hypothetical protein